MQLTPYHAKYYASFSEQGGYDFTLNQSPFPQIETGRYRIGKYITDAHTYRIGHPLAQYIIKRCKATSEPFVGQSGWLQVVNLTISSFEEEDHVLFAAFADGGTPLDEEQCHRLFSLEGKAFSIDNKAIPKEQLNTIIQRQTEQITQLNMERNANFFDDEMDKLDHWADDKRKSLKKELKELDEEIRLAKRQARTARSLPEKLSIQKKVRTREQKREQAWKNYEVESRNIENQKDELIGRIEQQLNHKITQHEVFAIRWTLI